MSLLDDLEFRLPGSGTAMGDFPPWLINLSANADCVVALARAAPLQARAFDLLGVGLGV